MTPAVANAASVSVHGYEVGPLGALAIVVFVVLVLALIIADRR